MRIVIFTGTRAEFGLLQPVMRACEALARDTRYAAEPTRTEWLASGMHLDPALGNTITLVRADGAPILAEVPFFHPGSSHAEIVGRGIEALSSTLSSASHGPDGPIDWLVVLGDRYESFAATVAATLSGIPVCHIHGGDRANSGHIDETFRHAITRFAALHCAATRTSHARLLRFGEEPWRTHWVGAPGIDRLKSIAKSPAAIAAASKLTSQHPNGLLLVILHPVSTESDQARDQAEWLCAELEKRPETKLCVLPNNDPGGQAIREILTTNAANNKHWLVFPNLDAVDYVAALSAANAFVGNSSSGVIEAPTFGLPMVHIGDRNRDRENAGHIAWVPWGHHPGTGAQNSAHLHTAIDAALTPAEHARVAALPNPYGDGNSAARIAELLWAFRGNAGLLKKHITY